MNAYPVDFDATPPTRYDRIQVLVRVLILVALAMLGGSLGWMYLLVYLALPLVAAAQLGGSSGEQFLARSTSGLTSAIRLLIGFYAYLGFLTDRFPSGDADEGIRFDIEPHGTPTVGSALLRLLTSLPGFIVGVIFGFVGTLVSIIAALYVLVLQRVPDSVFSLQRGIVRFQARLFAYHASLVDTQPPFAFDGTPHPTIGATT